MIEKIQISFWYDLPRPPQHQDHPTAPSTCTVLSICLLGSLIEYQSSRPPPHHSKDLHSMIVSAYQCIMIWLVEHRPLTRDQECLSCLLAVIEMGISGSKSQVGLAGALGRCLGRCSSRYLGRCSGRCSDRLYQFKDYIVNIAKCINT